MRTWANALHRWFFEEGDAASAAALRIGYGLVLLFLLWDLWPALDLLLGHRRYFGTLDPAYLPPSGLETFLYRHDFPGALRVWFWAATAAAACATLGLASRAAVRRLAGAPAPDAAAQSVHALRSRRGPAPLALWLAWLPSGRVWSCDRLIGAWAGRPARRTISLWPIKALQTQMALIYLAAGLAKVATEPWRDRYRRVLRAPQHRQRRVSMARCAEAPPRADDVRDRRHRARIRPAGVLGADALAGARPGREPPGGHRSVHGHPAVWPGHVPGPPVVRPTRPNGSASRDTWASVGPQDAPSRRIRERAHLRAPLPRLVDGGPDFGPCSPLEAAVKERSSGGAWSATPARSSPAGPRGASPRRSRSGWPR